MINCLLWIKKKILSLPFAYVLSNRMGKMGIRLLTRIMKNDRSILVIDTAYLFNLKRWTINVHLS